MRPRPLLPLLFLLLFVAGPAAASYSLAQVVANAVPGAVVRVPPGVHAVHLVLDKPIALVGSPETVLDGGGTGDVVRITASNVSVENVTIRDSGSSLTDMNTGIYVARHVHHVTIAHNRLENVLFGIYVDGADHVRVLDNAVVGMRNLRVPNRGDGIHLWNDHDCVVSGNEVSFTRDGIYVYISPDNLIEHNRIHDVRYGVHYMYSQHDTLRRNISYHNTAGFALMSSDHLQVVGNQAYDNMSYGLLLNYVNYSNIRDNEIRDTTGQFGPDGELVPGAEGKAIFVYLCQGNTIAGNLLARSRIGIHVTAGSTENRIYGNAFISNRVQVKYVQNLEQQWSWHRHGNYWSNYNGWDLNGDGIGDVPYRPNDGVDVLMWKYPGAQLLMSSPAILLLRYVQRAFPVFTPPGVTDSFPRMRPPARWRAYVDANSH